MINIAQSVAEQAFEAWWSLRHSTEPPDEYIAIKTAACHAFLAGQQSGAQAERIRLLKEKN